MNPATPKTEPPASTQLRKVVSGSSPYQPPIMRLILAIILLALPSGVSRAADPRGDNSFTVTPAVTGEQLVRTSLPLPRGLLSDGQTLNVTDGKRNFAAAVRPLSWHPVTNGESKSVRRALVTFPFSFSTPSPVIFSVRAVAAERTPPRALPVTAALREETVALTWKNGERVELILLAPARTSTAAPRLEVVEDNDSYRWQRWHFPDPQWPRIIELRSDALGGVVLVAHLQRNLPEDGRAPDFGWEAKTQASSVSGISSNTPVTLKGEPFRHNFVGGDNARFVIGKDGLAFYHPAAALKRRGHVALTFPEPGQLNYRYLRCTADEEVPMQPSSWQRAEMVIASSHLASLSATLESAHQVVVDSARWQELYGVAGEPSGALPAELAALVQYHRNAIVRCMAVGDDWGNVTEYEDAMPHGKVYGVNRLNHCVAIFEEGWRSGDRRLLETGVLWCDNFYDQSIWWGEKERGGTRYMDASRRNRTKPDEKYMWRSNDSVNFATKGCDAFWLAWEQTGDPRMREALDAQVAYAAQHVHAYRGTTRSIGDVRDFIRLHRFTGEQHYLDEALRLFRELRTVLSTGDLFDEGGVPLNPDPPFIELDKIGPKIGQTYSQTSYGIGYAKPYIIGYALIGLPELSIYAPDEPKLRDVVRAVANFLAESQDPVGGWRYPHPRSSSIMMENALENGWQITQAARLLGPDEKLLDAIEATLRQRIHGWRRTGKVFTGLEGWEIATGKVKERKDLYDLYKKPADRDMSRDYTEGRASFGSTPPEGIVYFTEVLGYYLQHRPAARLLAEPKPDSPLGQVLARVPATSP
ncbi:MAG: hypothetical protein Q8N18_12110 [Opitutaceae bacterium]|nr:hypothetical protein [Opitutaceae bacterium]